MENPILHFIAIFTFIFLFTGISGCKSFTNEEQPVTVWDSLTVTASAFNSTRAQTGTPNPNITAWGDTIEPGMKVLAVSRDLIAKGLEHNTEVIIEGIDGVFVVKDKMHSRWKNKIDIYMGDNIKKAKSFGRKKVKIFYKSSTDTTAIKPL